MERDDISAARRPEDLETPERYLELRERFAGEWRAGQLSSEGEAIMAELGLEDGRTWRSLLESETFQALLRMEPPADLAKAA